MFSVFLFLLFSCNDLNSGKQSVKMLISRRSNNSSLISKSINLSGSINLDIEVWHFSVTPSEYSTGPKFSKIGDKEKIGEKNDNIISLDLTQIELSYGDWEMALTGFRDTNMQTPVVKLETNIIVSNKGIEGENVVFENGILTCIVELNSDEAPIFNATESINNIKLIYNNEEADSLHWSVKFMTEADGNGNEITGKIMLQEKGYFYCYFCVFYDGVIYDSQKIVILSPIKGLVYKINSDSTYDIMNKKFNIGCTGSEEGDEENEEGNDDIEIVVPNNPVLKSKYVITSSDYEIDNEGYLKFVLPSELSGADIWLNVVNPTSEKINATPSLLLANLLTHNADFFDIVKKDNIKTPFKSDTYVDWRIESSYKIKDSEQLAKEKKNIIQKSDDISSEEVGTKKNFYVLKGINSVLISAECKYKATVDTANGERTLLVYLEDGIVREVYEDGETNGVPTDEEIRIYAKMFLDDGPDNDIYDKMTSAFGNDIGIFNAHKSNPYLKDYPGLKDYFISNNDYITILMAGIQKKTNNPFSKSTYYGYYYDMHNLLNSAIDKIDESYADASAYVGGSNERSMITLNAYTLSGDYMKNAFTMLAHEFQHLIHEQYFHVLGNAFSMNGHSFNNGRYSPNNTNEKYFNMTELFSSFAESFLAHFIAEKSGLVVNGPYTVGGFGYEKGYIDGTEENFDYNFGRGPYTLQTLGHTVSTWNDDLSSYGLVAGIANYLLVNYGVEVLASYLKAGVLGFEGIIGAINDIDKQRKIEMKDFLLEYGDALLLSANPKMKKPYSYNRNGFFSVNGLLVYSVNLWLFLNIDRYDDLGITSPTSNLNNGCDPYSVNFYKVINNANAGENRIYVGTSFNENLAIDVVVVQ